MTKELNNELILKICNNGNLIRTLSYDNTILCNLCLTEKLKIYIHYKDYNICCMCQKKYIRSKFKKNKFKKPDTKINKTSNVTANIKELNKLETHGVIIDDRAKLEKEYRKSYLLGVQY